MALLPLLASASDQDERRILIGIKLFPAVLAADLDIQNKISADNHLHVLLVYRQDRASAEELSERLESLKEGIRGIAIKTIVISADTLEDAPDQPIAAIFLTERMAEKLGYVIRFGREQNAITFSPFQNDVEQGIMTGLHVSDRILPYVNITALHSAGIQLKPFFLEVAKHHE